MPRRPWRRGRLRARGHFECRAEPGVRIVVIDSVKSDTKDLAGTRGVIALFQYVLVVATGSLLFSSLNSCRALSSLLKNISNPARLCLIPEVSHGTRKQGLDHHRCYLVTFLWNNWCVGKPTNENPVDLIQGAFMGQHCKISGEVRLGPPFFPWRGPGKGNSPYGSQSSYCTGFWGGIAFNFCTFYESSDG